MRIKEIKPKQAVALKWEYAYLDRPQPYEVPYGAILNTAQLEDIDPYKGIMCADCGKAILVKDARSSPLIADRDKTYLRYFVCQKCYESELAEHLCILEALAKRG